MIKFLHHHIREILCRPGVKVDLLDYESGWTPLHRALYFKNFSVAITLIKAGAKLGDEFTGDWKCAVAPKRDLYRSIRNYSKWTPNIDHEGNTPLDLLSCSLTKELTFSKRNLKATSVLVFGKADFILGISLPNTSGDIVRPRRVECLESSALDHLDHKSISSLVASKYHSVALTSCGKCYSWGHGRSGRLGHGDELTQPEPTLIQGLQHVIIRQVAVSENHTLALTSTGQVYAWGSNRYGQLGIGSVADTSYSAHPQLIKSLNKVIVAGISAGESHSVCFTVSGEVYSWGSNKSGQLGLRPSEVSSMTGGVCGVSVPKKVGVMNSLLTDIYRHSGSRYMDNIVLQVSAAHNSTLLLCRGRSRAQERFGKPSEYINEVYQFGHGSFQPSRVQFISQSVSSTMHGALDGTSMSSVSSDSSLNMFPITNSPVQVIQIAAGKYHNVALTSLGTVYTWGLGTEQLGHGKSDEVYLSTPQVVEALLPERGGGKIVYADVSSHRTCVVSESGDVYTWGSTDLQGALGSGNCKYQPIPKRVVGIKKAVVVACGEDHTLVLQSASLPTIPFTDRMELVTTGVSLLSKQKPLDNTDADLSQLDISTDLEEDIIIDNKPSKRNNAQVLSTSTSKAMETIQVWTQMPTLKDLCQRKLAENVNLRTILPLLSTAQTFCCSELTTYCNSFIKQNLDAVLVETSPVEMDVLLEALDQQVEASASPSFMLRIESSRKMSFDHCVTKKERRSSSISQLQYTERRTSRSESWGDSYSHLFALGANAAPIIAASVSVTGIAADSIISPAKKSFPADIIEHARKNSFDDTCYDFKDENPRPPLSALKGQRERSGSRDLETSTGVAKCIRGVRKKIASVDELERKLQQSSTPSATYSTNTPSDNASESILTQEQQDKLSRKKYLQAELRRLELLHSRLVAEEQVREQAEARRVSHNTTPSSDLNPIPVSNTVIQPFSTPQRLAPSAAISTTQRGIKIVEPPKFDIWTNIVSDKEAKHMSSAGSVPISSLHSSGFGNFPFNQPISHTPVQSKRGPNIDSQSTTPSGSVWGAISAPTSAVKTSREPLEASAGKPTLSTMMKNGRSVLSPPLPAPILTSTSIKVSTTSAITATTSSSSTNKKVSGVSSSADITSSASSFSLESFIRKPVQTSKQTVSVGTSVKPPEAVVKANPWGTSTGPSTTPALSSLSSPSTTISASGASMITKPNKPTLSTINSISSVSNTNKAPPKSLLEIQAEEERKHRNLFVHGNCVLDKYESAWSVGITRGAAASMRELMSQQEETLRREEQIRKDSELAKQLKKQEQDMANQSKNIKKNKNKNASNNNNIKSNKDHTASVSGHLKS